MKGDSYPSDISFFRKIFFLRRLGLRDGKKALFDEFALSSGEISHVSASMSQLVYQFKAEMAKPEEETRNIVASIDGMIKKLAAARTSLRKTDHLQIEAFDMAIEEQKERKHKAVEQFNAMWNTKLNLMMNEIAIYWRYSHSRYKELGATPPPESDLLRICKVCLPSFGI